VAFRTLGDATGPGYDEAQVNAIAALYEVQDDADDAMPGDMRTAKASDKFPANTSAGAPDLSLMAKARAGFHGPAGLGINQLLKGPGGAEYIHGILTGYTGETQDVAGVTLYENHVMAGGLISMPPPRRTLRCSTPPSSRPCGVSSSGTAWKKTPCWGRARWRR